MICTMRYLLFILFFLPGWLAGQTDPVRTAPSLHLVAKYTAGGTHLRWGYGDVNSWYANFRQGVTVYRRRVSPNPTEFQAIDIVGLLPDAELEQLAANDDSGMLGALHGVAYQDWENSIYQGEGDDFGLKRDNLNNRYVFYHYAADRSREAARAAGLSYVDTDVAPNVTYAYRVVSQGTTTVTAYKVVTPKVKRARPLVQGLSEEEGSVTLHWDRALHNRHFSGYFVERSEVGRDEWQRLTEAPYVQGYDKDYEAAPRFFSYTDRVANGKPLRYRIIGLDPFGDESEPSPVVVGQGRDRTPPAVPELIADESELLHLKKTLRWYQPPGDAVVAYHLERRFNNKSNLVIDFAGPGDTLRVDEPDEAGTYAYRLIAQDAAGNLAWSEPVVTIVHDRNAPAAPTGLIAQADTNGVVTLTWDAAKEKDVVGYYVFAADGEDRTFRRLTGQSHPYRRYRDTLDTGLANRYRYYTVMALDKDFLYSPLSDTLRVNRPDAIPPAPAQISDFRVLGGGIRLSFRHSNSADVIKHQLLRREAHNGFGAVIREWVQPPFNFTDTSAVADSTYFYAYRAVDNTGLLSEVTTELQVTAKRRELNAPELSVTKEENRIQLSWPARPEAGYWQLYRRVNGQAERRLTTLPGAALTFRDARTLAGQELTYRLRLVREDGRRSPFSAAVSVTK